MKDPIKILQKAAFEILSQDESDEIPESVIDAAGLVSLCAILYLTGKREPHFISSVAILEEVISDVR